MDGSSRTLLQCSSCSRETIFKDATSKRSQNLLQYFDASKFWCIFFFRSWKLTFLVTTCLKATLFQILTFNTFLYISETARQNTFETSSYHIRWWSFPWCNTLRFQEEPSLQTGLKSALQHSLFWSYAIFFQTYHAHHKYLHDMYTSVWILLHLLNVKHWQYSNWTISFADFTVFLLWLGTFLLISSSIDPMF